MTAKNPSVPHPGFEPAVMSLRPILPAPYSQGLRKPSGFRPFDIRKSLSSETTPATVWTLSVSWVPEN